MVMKEMSFQLSLENLSTNVLLTNTILNVTSQKLENTFFICIAGLKGCLCKTICQKSHIQICKFGQSNHFTPYKARILSSSTPSHFFC